MALAGKQNLLLAGVDVSFAKFRGSQSRLSLAATSQTVLPFLNPEDIDIAVARLGMAELALVMKHKILPLGPQRGSAISTAHSRKVAQDLALDASAQCKAGDVNRAVEKIHGPALAEAAAMALARNTPVASAERRFDRRQIWMAALLVVCVLAGAMVFSLAVLAIVLATGFSLFFLSLIALRIYCLLAFEVQEVPEHRPLQDDELPVYTILVPLFRETKVLPQLISGLTALHYPRHLLDIKLILEDGDAPLQTAVAALRLPEFFDVLTVPRGRLQTKPRALNYGMSFARGSLLTIYDAEDMPDSMQLRRAASQFAVADGDVACLQAELAFYNGNENWLTRQFALEYACLFRRILPALAKAGLPVLLGGTSNHFKVSMLKRLGAWDAFNVTEDADLGLRLQRAGFRTLALASVTHEEAITRPQAWLKQRSRWLKGFLQCWLVQMREPVKCYRSLGPAGFWVFQSLTLGVFVASLLHPLFLALTIVSLLNGSVSFEFNQPQSALAILSLVVLAGGYAATFLLGHSALGPGQWRNRFTTLLSFPLYWMMSMPAAVIALYDFASDPHHWRKTEHGQSRLQPPPQ
jgi:glycosyltransferase XagB